MQGMAPHIPQRVKVPLMLKDIPIANKTHTQHTSITAYHNVQQGILMRHANKMVQVSFGALAAYSNEWASLMQHREWIGQISFSNLHYTLDF